MSTPDEGVTGHGWRADVTAAADLAFVLSQGTKQQQTQATLLRRVIARQVHDYIKARRVVVCTHVGCLCRGGDYGPHGLVIQDASGNAVHGDEASRRFVGRRGAAVCTCHPASALNRPDGPADPPERFACWLRIIANAPVAT